MRSLKVLIWLLENDIDALKRTFNALYSRYGIEKLQITGVIGGENLSFQEMEVQNISLQKTTDSSFDYVIVVGLNLEISEHVELKQIFDEKIAKHNEPIIFDFEIYNGTFRFPNVCLVVIFNHRFDKNLPLLRKIYGSRFSNIRFLMPFYDGADSDVIPVYESSYQFQGYLIQAYEKLKDIPCSHYLFISDDLIINPAFDETNFVNRAKMYDKKFWITNFAPLNSPNMFRWTRVATSSTPFYNVATQWKDSIYTYDEAMAKFNEFFGAKYKEFYDEEFFGDPNKPGSNSIGGWNNSEVFFNVVNYFIMTNGNSLHIPYPMARGYSDIFCIAKGSLFEFSRLCGIFSAMNMFVEIAIPTAAVLTYKKGDVKLLKNEAHPRYIKVLSLESGLILWGNDRDVFESKYDRDFSKLVKVWGEELLCIHPIKLSGWKNI